MEKLSDIANLANSILNKETKYAADKKIITELFKRTGDDYAIQSIITRLTIIDSFYSTQMNKRYYGIEDIANKIWNISPNHENRINELFQNFAQNPQNEKSNCLFLSEYGISKDGKRAKKAISLISKYAYFQTNFKFPIYDELVKFTFSLITKKYFQDKKMSIKTSDIKKYINSINELNRLSKINDYNKLDNLLWLTGKILKGNFYLFFKEKEKYKEFTQRIDTYYNNDESDFSQKTIKCLETNKNNLKDVIVNDDLRDFVKFALDLKKV